MTRHVVGLLSLLTLASAYEEPAYGRAVHWVIRASRLDVTLNFTEQVLGMHVLRHEENENACDITCNGGFDTPWSKTMVGYEDENLGYALEITYNYGVDSYPYEAGSGLRRFVFSMPDTLYKKARKALKKKKNKQWKVREPPTSAFGERFVVTGPDGYMYELRLNDVGRRDNFYEVVLSCADPMALSQWYQDTLGMVQVNVGGAVDHPPRSVATAFPVLDPLPDNKREAVRFVFEWEQENKEKYSGGRRPNLTAWAGRSAIMLPEAKVREVHAAITEDSPELLVHDLREHTEIFGTLLMLVIRDPMGYEIAVVSDTFDTIAAAATDYVGPDWEKRATLGEKLAMPQAQEHEEAGTIEHDEL